MREDKKISKYNVVYGIIDDYSYLASHVSVSMAGGMTFGVPGAAIGLGVSIFDDFLIHNNYIKNKNLTHAFIGLTLGYNVYPSWISGVIGVCGSFLQSQGILKDYHSEINNLLGAIILGAKVNDATGAVIGSALSFADQILLYNNITNKYYFSYGLLGMTSFSVMLGKSTILSAAGMTLGLVTAHYANATTSIFQPIEISKDLYKIYLRIIPQEQLDEYIKDYAVILLSSQIVMNQLRIILLKHQQNSMYQFEHMDEPNGNPINKLATVTIKLGLFVLPYVVTEFVSDIFNSFYSTKLYIQVDERLRSILFLNETALKISFDKNNTVLIDNLSSDSKIISCEGSKLIIDSVTKSINGVYGVGVLIINVPELLVYLMLYNKGTECISNILAAWQNKYEILIKEQESAIVNLFKHDMNNIKIITETAGVLYSYNKLQLAHDKLRESELTKDQILHLITAWRSFESITNFISTYYLIGYKVGSGTVSFDNRINVHYSCLKVSSLLAWNGKKSREIKAIYQSLKRLDIFLTKTIYDAYGNIENIDNIQREQCIYDNKLVISNLNIMIANKQLMHVDYLELELGNRYAVLGPSGSGKSSFITKIIGVINNNIGGEGSIYYPKDFKAVSINQQVYFPLDQSMEEIIFYPGDINQEKIALVQYLLTKIGLTQYKLDQVEDWYSALSGGQKQETRIISAIVREPNVLILDEVFNGLDKESIDLMQTIIIETLPDVLIISIDHNALENNRTGFYTHSLEVINGELIDPHDKEGQYQNKHKEYIDYNSFNRIINDNQQCYDEYSYF